MQRPQQLASRWRSALFLSLAIAACFPTTGLGQTDSSQHMSRSDAVTALITWFECDDCGQGGLKAVTRYGEAIVPSLVATLNAGPSPARRERLRRSRDAGYDELASQAGSKLSMKLASSKEEYVARYLANLDARYRIRAAQALAAIGGTNARRALETALGKAERDDVRTAIQQSLNEIR